MDVLRLVGEEHFTVPGDLHELGALARHRLLEHAAETARAGMLEGHVALVGDHRPELRLHGHGFEANFQEFRVLEREGVLRLRLVELPEGGLHNPQASRPSPQASRRVTRPRRRGRSSTRRDKFLIPAHRSYDRGLSRHPTHPESGEGRSITCSRRARVLGAATVACALIGASAAQASPNNNTVEKLTKAVTAEGVLDHLEALPGDRRRQRRQPRLRAARLQGVGRLRRRAARAAPATTPQVQEFTFDYFEENSKLIRGQPEPAGRSSTAPTSCATRSTRGTPEGTATGPLRPGRPRASTRPGRRTRSSSGCEAADFAGFPAGGVALVQRGTCGFNVKVLNAQAAGAGAVDRHERGPARPHRPDQHDRRRDRPDASPPSSPRSRPASTSPRRPGATVTVTVDFVADERTA